MPTQTVNECFRTLFISVDNVSNELAVISSSQALGDATGGGAGLHMHIRSTSASQATGLAFRSEPRTPILEPPKVPTFSSPTTATTIGHSSSRGTVNHHHLTPTSPIQSFNKMFTFLRPLLTPPTSLFRPAAIPTKLIPSPPSILTHLRTMATYNQVRKGCRKPQKARKPVSPALRNRPCMKGVCLKVWVTKPKKPNSADRKIATVKLSSERVIQAYIPGEGTLWSKTCGGE